MRFKYYTCDVFTNTRFGGNPLAVLPNAQGLTTEQMQLIAREFNYSESTFVLPAEHGNTRQVRIFTRQQELPFAGHPNVGTAFTLATIGELGDFDSNLEVVFEEKAGLVPVSIRKDASGAIFSELKAPETLSLGEPMEVELIARALGLLPEDIVVTTHPPQVASVGLPFIITELKDRSVLERVRPDTNVHLEIEALGTRPNFLCYIHANDDVDIRARMFAPLGGTIEDPATGSANCGLAGLLAHYQPSESGEFAWSIAQGVEMGRPSLLKARAAKQDGEVSGVWIGGNSVMITEGYIEV